MADSFETVIALERISENEHRVVVPDGWQQGRGAFGGLVLGMLMEAMAARDEDAARVARTFTGDVCGPALPGESRIVTRVLRRGNNQTNLSATLEQGGAVVAHASAVLASARKVSPAPRLALKPPVRAPYDETEELPMTEVRGPFAPPVFARHYEHRPTGPLPFRGGAEALVLGWVRERVPLSRMTAAALLGRIDAYWPALFSVETRQRPMATVSFLAELLCDPATLDPRAPLFYRAQAVAEAAGYVVEMRELWSGDQPVVLNQQSFAMLG